MNRLTTRSHKLAVTLLSTLILSACSIGGIKSAAPGPAAQSTGLNPQQARITDERILADRRTIEDVQSRLRKLSEAGVPQNSYSLAKAQCWLDTAKSQYHENDRTGYVEESLSEAVKIAQALEANKFAKAGFDTPLVARSTMLRDDLWKQLNAYKNQASLLSCNAKTVACAEIRLVRAGHAEEQTGWRQATPWVNMVERDLVQAKAEADKCVAPAVVAVAPVPVIVAPPVRPLPPQIVTRENFVLLGDALFKFDKSSTKDMTAGGVQRLTELSTRLKSYQSIQSLVIVGHTDRLGGSAYNDRLSEARARTVLAYLESLGVRSASTTAQGRGEQEPVSTGCEAIKNKQQLIACLQPDRRVTVEVSGIVR